MWLQAMTDSGTASAYNIILEPEGGQLIVGQSPSLFVFNTKSGNIPRLYFGPGPSHSSWKVSVQDTTSEAFEIASSTADGADPSTLAYTNKLLLSSSGTLTVTGSMLALFFQSATANPADSGALRLASADSITWRNNANTADIVLGINASDQLTFAGAAITLHGVTASIGGSALLVGTAATGTVVITGASAAVAAGKCICVTPNTFPGASFSWNRAYISATDTVTVQVFADVAGTPTASTYNVTIV